MQSTKQNKQPASLHDILQRYKLKEKNSSITQEFQDFGYRLAREMGEPHRKGMYIRLAKTEKRWHLERARYIVLETPKVRNKGRLFLWTLNKLKKGESLAYQPKKKP